MLEVAEQSVRHRKPLIYQEIGGERKTVAGEYVLAASGEVGFEVAAYDATRPLVIDPVIEYTATLGGSGDEEGLGIDVDAADNVYVVGYTSSSDFETATNLSGVFDAFVAKLNTAGDLVYATYFGGGGLDAASEIAVDSAGSAYIVGITDSTNFRPRRGRPPAQETNAGGFDAFVAKLDASGGLVYATYLGGPGDENGSGIAIDDAGRAYVTGNTDSTTDFPTTTDAYQENYAGGELDVFVTELAPDGSSFPYSTYLGGIKQETGGGITVDAVSDVYITGTTTSIDFPTTAGSYRNRTVRPSTSLWRSSTSEATPAPTSSTPPTWVAPAKTATVTSRSTGTATSTSRATHRNGMCCPSRSSFPPQTAHTTAITAAEHGMFSLRN